MDFTNFTLVLHVGGRSAGQPPAVFYADEATPDSSIRGQALRYLRLIKGQLLALANAVNCGSVSTATGRLTSFINGKSLWESL